MTKKSFSIVGVILLLIILQSCQSKPEEGLLKRYFHADSLNDVTTMSTIALEPISLDAADWRIVEVRKDIVEPVSLPDLYKKELEMRKKWQDSVDITMNARDDLDDAKFELENARTRAAKRKAQKKVDELQAKYDEQYDKHYDQITVEHNEARAAAAREEEISSFSLGAREAREISNMRELSGEVHFKEVEVEIKDDSGTKNIMFYLRKYSLKDESLNLHRRGRWIIVKFEPLN